MKLTVCLFTVLFRFYANIFSQNLSWVVYDTTNSPLLYNATTSVVSDEYGAIWAVSYTHLPPDYNTLSSELVKFDGNDWEIFNSSNSGFPNEKGRLSIEKPDILWIAAGEKGLVKYAGNNWTVYDSSNSPWLGFPPTCIKIDKSENKWIGTRGGGLIRLFPDNISYAIYDTLNSGLPDNDIYSIEISGSNNIWILTGVPYSNNNNIISRFDIKTQTINIISLEMPPEHKGAEMITDFKADEEDNLWITLWNYNGLVKLSVDNQINYLCTIEHSDDLMSLAIDKNNNKWIGMNGPWGPAEIGLLKYDNIEWTFYSISNSELPSNNIYSIAVDKFNNKWIGTREGLVIYNEEGIVSNVTEGLDEFKSIPYEFNLMQNYPNPFNPNTTIKYSIPLEVKIKNSKLKNVVLKVYDILGSEVASLVNENQKPGNYEVEFNGSNLASGIYFCRLLVYYDANGTGDPEMSSGQVFAETKKMILLK